MTNSIPIPDGTLPNESFDVEPHQEARPGFFSTRNYSLWILALIMLAVMGVASDSFASVVTTGMVFGIAAIGVSMLGGPLRVVNLGASAFIGVGAFTAAYLNNVVGLDLILSLIAAAAACMLVGALVAPVASRLTGIYMAIITVGLAFLAQHIFRIATPWTGGTSGVQIRSVPFLGWDLMQPVTLGPITLSSVKAFYLVTLIVLLLVVATAVNVLRSRTGRAWYAIGESTLTARAFGISPEWYRTLAILHASALAGLAGGLLAVTAQFVAWEQFDLIMSVNLLAVVVLGGLGSVYGVLAGSLALYTLPKLVDRFADVIPFVAANPTAAGLSPEQFTTVLYGLALAVVMIAEPGGFAAIVDRVRLRLAHSKSTE